jgi:hypothetical protein
LNIGQVALSAAAPRRQWTIDVSEECNYITWGVGTVDAGVGYQLAEVIIRYVPIGYKELDNV